MNPSENTITFMVPIDLLEKMVQLLRVRGYETQEGLFGGVHTKDTIPEYIWNECIELCTCKTCVYRNTEGLCWAVKGKAIYKSPGCDFTPNSSASNETK